MWHVREALVDRGELIAPGRWGEIITARGQSHPFFYREQLLELYRVTETKVPVSRLACAFAFEDRAVAAHWAREGGLFLHRVEPAATNDAGVRLDMLWITWMGEPASTFSMNMSRCRAYWAGQCTRDVNPAATPAWEWLLVGGLRVISAEDA